MSRACVCFGDFLPSKGCHSQVITRRLLKVFWPDGGGLGCTLGVPKVVKLKLMRNGFYVE
ncbi:MAG: hypothetical protein KTR17_05135 [Cellvibrionaceae bacterium]|nr:hypothetical protein [Cellvibrionaceae bacterium]